MPEEELHSSKFIDPITYEPTRVLKIGGEPIAVPDLKMIYSNTAILALFDELDYYAEDRQWNSMKTGLL